MSSGTFRRRRRWLILAAALLVALAVAERRLHDQRSRVAFPPAGAAWIWSTTELEGTRTSSFVAVGDFALASRPSEAELLVAADERYQLYLNGRWMAAGQFDGALHAYPVAELLRVGGNRLVVELASSRGPGGFLLCLRTSDRSCSFVSGEHWRVAKWLEPGMLAGWWPLDHGEPPGVWGLAPLGRWSLDEVEHRPPLGDCLSGERSIATHERDTDPLRYVFDELAEGFLELGVSPQETARNAHYGVHAAVESDGATDLPLVVAADVTRWRSTAPVRARLVTVSGLAGLNEVEIHRLRDSACLAAYAGRERPATGIWGIRPGSGSAVEDEGGGEP